MKSIVINNQIIEYELKRNAKKNVNVRIADDLTLKVSAPKWMTISEIEKSLLDMSSWIIKHLEKQKTIKKKEITNVYENGSEILFRGEKNKLLFQPSDTNDVLAFNNQIIVLSKRADDLDYTQSILGKWLKATCINDFTIALKKYSSMMASDYRIPDYTLYIKSMKSMWGSCTPSKKKITLNVNLIYAPRECLEYVALHELAHFIELNHNARFYSIISNYLPNYKEIRNVLNKEYGQIIIKK